jgi:hypothetical protein
MGGFRPPVEVWRRDAHSGVEVWRDSWRRRRRTWSAVYGDFPPMSDRPGLQEDKAGCVHERNLSLVSGRTFFNKRKKRETWWALRVGERIIRGERESVLANFWSWRDGSTCQ